MECRIAGVEVGEVLVAGDAPGLAGGTVVAVHLTGRGDARRVQIIHVILPLGGLPPRKGFARGIVHHQILVHQVLGREEYCPAHEGGTAVRVFEGDGAHRRFGIGDLDVGSYVDKLAEIAHVGIFLQIIVSEEDFRVGGIADVEDVAVVGGESLVLHNVGCGGDGLVEILRVLGVGVGLQAGFRKHGFGSVLVGPAGAGVLGQVGYCIFEILDYDVVALDQAGGHRDLRSQGVVLREDLFDGDEISHLAGLIEEGHRAEELTFSHEYLLLLLAHYLRSCCLFDNDIAHAEAGGMVHAIITVGVDGCFQGEAVGAFSHQGAPYGVGGAALPEYGGAIARPHSCAFAITGIRQHGTVNSVHEGVGRREGTPNGRFVEEVGRMGVERIVAG